MHTSYINNPATVSFTGPECERPCTPLNDAQNAADRIEKQLSSLVGQFGASLDSLIGSVAETDGRFGQPTQQPVGRIHTLIASLANIERLCDALQHSAHRLSAL